MSGGNWSRKRVLRERQREQMARLEDQVRADEAAGRFIDENRALKIIAEKAVVVHSADGSSALFFKDQESADQVHRGFSTFRPTNFVPDYAGVISHQRGEDALYEIPVTRAFAKSLERELGFPLRRIRENEVLPENTVPAAWDQFAVVAGRKAEGEDYTRLIPTSPVTTAADAAEKKPIETIVAPTPKKVVPPMRRSGGHTVKSNMFGRLYERLSELPVAAAAGDIAESVLKPQVTVLSAETGSGKTLYATSKLADLWRDKQEEGEHKTVLALVPRRFLAMNAAKTIAELSGTRLGGPVGYAIGRKPGDESCFSDETRLLFTTYGYALQSKLLDKASIVVLDEVHEQDKDIGLARALLHDRLQWKENVKVMEMSATLNAARQAAYWEDVAPTKVFNVEGKTHPCERRHKPDGNVVESVMELLQQGKKGILVFRPGIADIRETAEMLAEARDQKLREIEQAVTAQMRQASTPRGDREIADAVRRAQEASGLLGLEIEQIYGELAPVERRRALEPPAGNHAKVLIGTNVIESGTNIPWVDAGVSCGTGKQKNVDRTGAHSLDLEVLPQWRLVQQEGRVKRFKPGVFALASDIGWEDRPLETKSELERLPLTDVLMQVVRHNLDPHRLTFDPPLDERRLQQAKKELMRLGLVDEQFKPTEAGKFTSSMPLTAEGGAMLWHAKQIGILKAALPVAALMMTGSIRFDHRRSHGLDYTSDSMDAVKAFLAVAQSPDHRTMERLNVNYQKFLSAYALFESLAKTVNRMPDSERQQSSANEEQMQQCVLAGRLNQLFKIEDRYLVSPHHENKFYTGLCS